MQQTIREMTKHLMELGDKDWGRYAFRHEPLERKLSEAQKETYTRLAMECGREEADLIKTGFPECTVEEVVRAKGIQIKTPDIPNGGGHVIFAQYEESGRITIFMDCIKKAEELIAVEQMEELFTGAVRLS